MTSTASGSDTSLRGLRDRPFELLKELEKRSRTVVANSVAETETGQEWVGVAFRTVEDMTFVRIFSGVVATGSQMLNSVSASPERIGRMIRMHANHTEEVEEARAGDIVALAGLKHTNIGDTLCDPAAPVILEPVPASAGRVK